MKDKFLTLLLKLHMSFLIKCNKNDNYDFLENNFEKIIANMYDMNFEQKQPSYWIRVMAFKN